VNDSTQGRSISRRDRLKRDRRECILDAAEAVFARKGFHGATIREIAHLADVADGTIYNYFDNKLDMLLGIMGRVTEVKRLPSELKQALQGDVRDFFVAAFHDRTHRIEQGEQRLQAILPQVPVHPELRNQYYEQHVRRIATLLERYVQAQVESGRIRQVDVPLTVRMVHGMFIGLLILRLLGDEPLRDRWEEVPDLLATLIFDGLNPDTRG